MIISTTSLVGSPTCLRIKPSTPSAISSSLGGGSSSMPARISGSNRSGMPSLAATIFLAPHQQGNLIATPSREAAASADLRAILPRSPRRGAEILDLQGAPCAARIHQIQDLLPFTPTIPRTGFSTAQCTASDQSQMRSSRPGRSSTYCVVLLIDLCPRCIWISRRSRPRSASAKPAAWRS